MESKENHDIFSIVANTIIKWYEQTHTTMTIAIKPFSGLDVELMGILLAAKKQTLGALTTLTNQHILSTHALLRVLVESFVVLAWALKVSASERKDKYNEVHERLKRWELTRLKKDRALLNDFPQTPERESDISKINSDIEKFEKSGIKELPNNKQLFCALGGENLEEVKKWQEVYAKFYRSYSRAVHLNRKVTQKLAWTQNDNQKPTQILYKDDIEPNGDELVTIACISCDINKAIRGFYGWKSDAMQNEYEQLKSSLVKK